MKAKSFQILLCISLFTFAQSQIQSEERLLMNDSIQLPGTLTYDASIKSQPLVIFVQGSGNPDRNGNQPAFGVNINYIKLLRDRLNANGIAFYSYDKRNVTPSNLKFILKKFEFKDLAMDVEVAISEFKDEERFSSITLVGHSQGSLVAMLAINDQVDKYVSLAGLGETVDKAMIRQITAQSEALGDKTAAHFKELKETGDIKNEDPMLLSLFAKPNLPFFQSYMSYNPSEAITELSIPVLILNGNKDLQVLVNDAELLHKAKPDAELVIIDKMNHVLKELEKDSQNLLSYTSPDFPLSNELVDVITTFVKK
ncbi:MAG: alpha/beta hydrolase [Psychroserpens sp.]|nr:alpha/beta hydrolase [Psychroserpens sp.]